MAGTSRMRRVLTASASAVFMMPAMAAAQVGTPPVPTSGAVPDTAASPGDKANGGLADIVVTAQRRSENLQRVPIAVSAVSGDALLASAITSTVQLNAVAPGLNIRTNNGSFTPYLRGIGTSSNVVENPVALYIDGVYLPQQREGLRELNDIEQIAVLKGPQGTLFGRNATGGVIQITTRAPSRTFGAEVGSELDNYLTWKNDAYVTGPISSTLAFSLSGQYAKQFDSYGRNLTTSQDNYQLRKQISVRGKLLYEPGANTRFTLIADYLDRAAFNNSFRPLLGTQFSIPGFGPSTSRYDIYAGVEPYSNFRGGGVSLSGEQTLGFAKIVLISAYRKGTSQTLQSPSSDPMASFTVYQPSSHYQMYSEELQLVSNPGRFTWVAGAFYFHNDNGVDPATISFKGPFAPGPASTARIDNYGIEHAKSIAPFGQFSWEFLHDTTLTGGVRYTVETRSAQLSRILTLNNGFVIRPAGIDQSITFREPTFRAALSHQFSNDTLGYLSFNTGFKSGGFNIINSANPSYLPEKLTAYEVGLKSQFLDRRVRLNVAAFYYDYSNVQVARFSQGMQTISNGASAKLYGLDADIEAKVDDQLRLKGGLALEHTEFTSFPNAVLGIPQANGSVVLTSGSATGNRLPLAQEVQVTLGTDYHRPLPIGMVDADVTVNYNGPYFFEPDNILRQGAYVMVNASIRLTLPNNRVSFSIFGKNLLDETIISSPTTQTFGYDVTYAAPRTYGIAARFKF